MINLTTEYQQKLEGDSFAPCYLISLPSLYLTTAPDDVIYKTDIYVSGGQISGMDSVGATTDISADTYTITLDNADQTALSIYANSNYVGTEVSVLFALLHDDGSLILDANGDGPFEIYKGVFDGWGVQENLKTSTIKIKLKSHWAAFNRKAGRFTNSSSQQERYPLDTFFNFAHEDVKDVRWGGAV